MPARLPLQHARGSPPCCPPAPPACPAAAAIDTTSALLPLPPSPHACRCTLVNSALATNVTGQIKDILTTALGMVLFGGAGWGGGDMVLFGLFVGAGGGGALGSAIFRLWARECFPPLPLSLSLSPPRSLSLPLCLSVCVWGAGSHLSGSGLPATAAAQRAACLPACLWQHEPPSPPPRPFPTPSTSSTLPPGLNLLPPRPFLPAVQTSSTPC